MKGKPVSSVIRSVNFQTNNLFYWCPYILKASCEFRYLTAKSGLEVVNSFMAMILKVAPKFINDRNMPFEP